MHDMTLAKPTPPKVKLVWSNVTATLWQIYFSAGTKSLVGRL